MDEPSDRIHDQLAQPMLRGVAMHALVPSIDISNVDHRANTADDIKRLREKLRFSQPVFAHHLHTTASTVRKWEQGETRRPDRLLSFSM